MDIQYIAFIVFAFIAALFAFEAIYYWWAGRFGQESIKLKKRIEAISHHDLDRLYYQGILKNRYAENQTGFSRFLFQFSFAEKIDAMLLQAGGFWTLSTLIQYSGVAAFIGLILGFYFNLGLVLTLIVTLVALFGPLFYVQYKKKLRLALFEEQLPEAIDTIVRSLKAGHAFTSAFTLVGEELPDPIASEFRITMEENNLGIDLNLALQNLAERIPLTDLKFFIVAILIQRETGGNLSEILGNISNIMRERFKLKRQIGVMTAEGRLSAKILGAMPLVMLGLMSVLNPTYGPLMFHTPTGIYWLKVGGAIMLVGFVWMRSIINIRM